MGVSLADIAAAAEELQFIEHRLQLTTSNGINILDDGYNANVKGARAALDVLRTFGGRKIVVTPGIVELGILEETENKQFGGLLAGFDYVILVGDTLVTPVKEGYYGEGGDPAKLMVRETLKDAQAELKKILKKGDTVLFLNDLPAFTDCKTSGITHHFSMRFVTPDFKLRRAVHCAARRRKRI